MKMLEGDQRCVSSYTKLSGVMVLPFRAQITVHAPHPWPLTFLRLFFLFLCLVILFSFVFGFSI